MKIVYRFDSVKTMDILQKELTYFLELAETQNVSKASEKLGIQQSGLSRALQRLEGELGQRLFHRKNNGLLLTKEGQLLFEAIRSTQKAWDTAFQSLMNQSEIPAGIVKIGFHPSFGQKYFPQIVEALGKKFPNIEIEAHTLRSADVTRKVNEQELDIGIVISRVKNPELVQKKVGTDYIAGFQKNPAATPAKILFNPDMQFSTPIMKKHGQTKKVIIQDYEIMASVCQKTNSLAILPNSVAEKYPDLSQIGGAYLKAEVSCISHKSKLASATTKKIFEAVVDACLGR